MKRTKRSIKVISLSSDTESTEQVELSPSCPRCGVSLLPTVISAVLVDHEYGDEEYDKLFLLNHCPTCDKCFLSEHSYNEDDDGYDFISFSPVLYSQKDFSPEINQLSPNFVKIYNEAFLAESSGLLSICGMGYRKALEFLIKDYSIRKKPEDRDIIISKPLMFCINAYIESERLHTLAQASAWLGNDETHYIKKHNDYDFSDMKVFIDAFITFVDSDLAYEKAAALTKKH